MSNSTILLFFANQYSQQSWLENLNEERRSIYEILSSSLPDYQILSDPHVSLDYFFDSLQERKGIKIIHFGGHSDGEKLFFVGDNGDKEEIAVKVLTNFISTLSGIKLVFLNGCGSKGFVKELLLAGVGSVIATKTEISDRKSRKLAKRFYKGIAEGFTIEESFEQMNAEWAKFNKFEIIESGIDKFRGLVRKGTLIGNQFEWGLYYFNKNKDILTWRAKDTSSELKSDRSNSRRTVAAVLGVLLVSIISIFVFQKTKICRFETDSPDNYNLLVLPFGEDDDELMTGIKKQIEDLKIIEGLPVDLGFDERFEKDISLDQAKLRCEKCESDLVAWGDYIKDPDTNLDSLRHSISVRYSSIVKNDPFLNKLGALSSNIRLSSKGLFLTEGKLIGGAKSMIFYLVGKGLFDHKNDYEKALSFFERVNIPNGVAGKEQIYFMIGSCYRKIGEKDLENARYEAASKSFLLAKENYLKAISEDYDFPHPHHDLGVVLFHESKYDSAISKFNQTLQLNIDSKIESFTYLNLGNCYFISGNTEESKYNFRKSLSIDSELIESKLGLAATLRGIDSLETAIALYNEIIQLDSTYPLVFNNRANIYYQKKENELALADYTKAIKLYPKYYEALTNRGNLYRRMGNFEKAKSDYNESISINPIYIRGFYNLGRLIRQQANRIQEDSLQKTGLQKEAIENFNKVIELNPSYFQAYDEIGIIYYDQKKFSDAEDNFRMVLQIRPNDFYGRYNLVSSQLKLGKEKYNLAEQNALILLKNEGEDEDTLGLLAEVYAYQRRESKFIKTFEKALKLGLFFEEEQLDKEPYSFYKEEILSRKLLEIDQVN